MFAGRSMLRPYKTIACCSHLFFLSGLNGAPTHANNNANQILQTTPVDFLLEELGAQALQNR